MKELFERLKSSEEFKKFKEEYPDSYFCTAFFVSGKPEEIKKQLNYSISENEVMSFDMGEKIVPLKLRTVKGEKSPEIKEEEVKINAEQAAKNVEKHANKKFGKLIVVLQRIGDEVIWNITCMDGFQLHRFHVSAFDGKVHDQKGINIREMMRVEKKDPSSA